MNADMERTFQESAWKLSEVTDKPITKNSISQLHIKLEQLTEEKLDIILIKLNVKKLQVSMNYLRKYGRQGNLMTYFLGFAMLFINRIQKEDGQKAASSPSPRKVTSESLRTTEA